MSKRLKPYWNLSLNLHKALKYIVPQLVSRSSTEGRFAQQLEPSNLLTELL